MAQKKEIVLVAPSFIVLEACGKKVKSNFL